MELADMGYRGLLAHDAAVRLTAAAQPLLKKIERKDFRLARHVRKTLASMEDNAAEGGESTTPGRKANFFRIARDSCGEGENQFSRAYRLGFITFQELVTVGLLLKETKFYLNRLIDKWENEH